MWCTQEIKSNHLFSTSSMFSMLWWFFWFLATLCRGLFTILPSLYLTNERVNEYIFSLNQTKAKHKQKQSILDKQMNRCKKDLEIIFKPFPNKTKPNHGWLCLFVCYGKWLNGCWLNVKETNTWCDQKKQWGIALYSDFHNWLFSTHKCRNLHLRKPPWYSRRKKTWEKPDSKGNLSSSELHQIGKYW